LFTGIVATLGATFVWENGAHYAIFQFLGIDTGDNFEGPTTPDLEWPTWVVYSAIPLGSSLMCFRFLQVCVAFIRTGELPHHDHGHVEGLDDEKPAVDINPYGLDDNLHMLDMKHRMIGENRRTRNEPVAEDRRKEDLGGEPK
jgi:C4-dicarboxylate transporter DctQ subunit